MTVRDKVPASVLCIGATGLGLSSTLQAYWLHQLSPDQMWIHTMPKLLVLNLIYWYVPAALGPAIMALATRYRVGRARWPLVVAVHVCGVLVYAVLHNAAMLVTRVMLFPDGPIASGCWRCLATESLSQLGWLLMTYLFFVGLAHALAYRRESEARALNASRLETSLAEAQLQALQRQVHPHFLFNTLNTIAGLMRSDVNAADRMIDQLGDLLRMTLHASGSQVVTLSEELDTLRTYLDIEETRLGGRLSVSMQIDPDTQDALVPNLLLQPLVENAVRHGVAPHARAGRITVATTTNESQLTITIRDNGDGVPSDRLTALNHGVGLANSRARLEHLYHSAFQFRFSNVDDGFLVTVIIPFQTAATSAEPVPV